jgi:hypothetical protein
VTLSGGLWAPTPEPSRFRRDAVTALVGCGKAKQSRPAPACSLYTGTLTRTAVVWAARNCGRYFILSAKYGLLPPARVTPPYDLKITDLGGPERAAWGRSVQKALRTPPARAAVYLVLAGKEYLAAVGAVLGADVLDVFAGPGWPVGRRVQWLQRHPHLTDAVFDEIIQRNRGHDSAAT